MDLLLIRHALPVRIEGGDGPADPELSDDGWRQAGALAAWLADDGIDAMVASPLRRAQETAAPLAERCSAWTCPWSTASPSSTATPRATSRSRS